MTRYYYSCPLQAAYMAKEFGMRILATHHGEQIDTHGNCIAYCEHEFGWESPFYIRPDSQHLLHPKRGDLVLATYTKESSFVYRHVTMVCDRYYLVGGFPDQYGYPDYINNGDRKILKVIQRNGKPFFWPEVE